MCLHGFLDGSNQLDQALGPLGKQRVLASQVVERFRVGVVKDLRDLVEPEADLAVEQDPLQPSQIVAGIAPVASRRPVAGNQQPDLVVVVQGAHRHAGERGDLPNDVRVCSVSDLHAIDARASRHVRVKPGGTRSGA